jgi:hypothetical protein
MQRRYATMTKEDFTKLLDQNRSPEQFASDLAMIKADKEDLTKLQTNLNEQIKDLRQTIDNPSIGSSIRYALFVIGVAMCCPSLKSAVGAIFLGIWLSSNEYNNDKERLKKDEAKLKHFESFIEHNKE